MNKIQIKNPCFKTNLIIYAYKSKINISETYSIHFINWEQPQIGSLIK
jgi:hypothetical protein